MKKLVFLSVFALAILATSCKLESLTYYDDIYSSSTDAQYVRPNPTSSNYSNSNAAPNNANNSYNNAANSNNYNNNYNNNSNNNNVTYYYDEETGLYYDANSNTYYDPNTGNYYSGTSSNSNSYSDGNGNTYITNNYYFDDDSYYDYYYTSRIRRFHSCCDYGWSYYDPYFTRSIPFWNVSSLTKDNAIPTWRCLSPMAPRC